MAKVVGPRRYDVVLTGVTPFIMHADNFDQQAKLDSWRKHPDNKEKSVKGDDRSPSWTWQTYLYTDGEAVVLPQENLRSCLMQAGGKCAKTKGKGSMKTDAVSSILFDTPFLPFLCNGKTIYMTDVLAIDSEVFLDHVPLAQKLGMELFAKRAAVGTAKHVRVRPLFRAWTVTTTVEVVSDAIDKDMLNTIFAVAGKYVGLGDWRPSAKKSPGPYGQFTVKIS
jgi:hypothetical protein